MMDRDVIKSMTREELLLYFCKAVEKATLKNLGETYVGDIVDEGTDIPVGKFHLFYAFFPDGSYLTYGVFYENNERLYIYSVDKECTLADYHHDNEKKTWSDIHPVTINGEDLVSRSEIIENVVSKFRELLKV